ncbi:MAG: TrmH family RNA methyltransferase, partial [Acetanaerobacterium sp.]
MEQKQPANNTDVIVGRNAVLEALRSGREIDSLLIQQGERQGSILKIVALCREKGVPVKDVSGEKISFLAQGETHQGVAAIIAAVVYVSVADILSRAREKDEPPFVVIADGIEDPHNLGALIRTAEAAGAHGMIIPKRRSASVTTAVYKASA